jgi:hypothetical protein
VSDDADELRRHGAVLTGQQADVLLIVGLFGPTGADQLACYLWPDVLVRQQLQWRTEVHRVIRPLIEAGWVTVTRARWWRETVAITPAGQDRLRQDTL